MPRTEGDASSTTAASALAQFRALEQALNGVTAAERHEHAAAAGSARARGRKTDQSGSAAGLLFPLIMQKQLREELGAAHRNNTLTIAASGGGFDALLPILLLSCVFGGGTGATPAAGQSIRCQLIPLLLIMLSSNGKRVTGDVTCPCPSDDAPPVKGSATNHGARATRDRDGNATGVRRHNRRTRRGAKRRLSEAGDRSDWLAGIKNETELAAFSLTPRSSSRRRGKHLNVALHGSGHSPPPPVADREIALATNPDPAAAGGARARSGGPPTVRTT
jgi:hypothetical protein